MLPRAAKEAADDLQLASPLARKFRARTPKEIDAVVRLAGCLLRSFGALTDYLSVHIGGIHRP